MVPVLKSLHRLNHRCTGCGRSCEGAMVAQRPLDPTFMASLPTLVAALGGGDVASFVAEVGGEPRLKLTGQGTCAFLNTENKCSIRDRVGVEAMPTACRLFPLRLVQTETGLRIGASPTCYEAWQSPWQGGPASPFTLAGYAPGQIPDSLVVAHAELAAGEVALEARLLRLLSQDETTPEAILATLVEAALEASPVSVEGWWQDEGVGAAFVAWSHAVGQRLAAEVEGAPVPPSGHLAAATGAARFAMDLERISVPSLSRVDRTWLREVLSQWIFTRSHVGVMPLAVGVVALVSAAMLAAHAAAAVDVAQASATFARTLTTWTRVVEEHPLVFAEQADPLALLDALAAARRARPAPPLDRLLEAAGGLGWSRGEGTFVLDLNHHVAHGLFAHLAPFERRDERLAFGRTYDGFQTLAGRGLLHPAATLMLTTSAGKVFFERYAMAHLPAIPTALYDHGDPDRLRREVLALLPRDRPGRPAMFVRKNLLSHRGEGVVVFPVAAVETALADARPFDLFQPFLYGGYDDGHQRNFRAILVGDEVALLYERKAPQPLLLSGELATFPPEPPRYLTNSQFGGQLRVVEPEDHPEVVEVARRARAVFADAEREFRARHRVTAPFDGALYLSVDTFRDDAGTHHFNELHLSPELVRDDHLDRVTDAMTRHIRRLLDDRHVADVFMIGRENLAAWYHRKLAAAGIPLVAMERLVEGDA